MAVDRFGRRPVLAFAIFAATCLLLGLGLSRQLWVVIVDHRLRGRVRLGPVRHVDQRHGRRPDPLGATLRGLQHPARGHERRHHAGPAGGHPLIAADQSFRTAFVVGGAICAVFLLVVLTLLGETKPVSPETESFVHAFGRYRVIVRDRRLLLFCLVALLPLYVFGQVWVTMPIMLGDLQGVTAAQWGLLMVAYGLPDHGAGVPRGAGAAGPQRHHHAGGRQLPALALGVGAGAVHAVPGDLRVRGGHRPGPLAVHPISATVVSHLAPTALRGRYMGAWTLVYMGGYALGPLLGGRALDAFGGRAAFVLAGAIGLTGGAVFLLLRTSVRGRVDEAAALEAAEARGELRGERPEQAV